MTNMQSVHGVTPDLVSQIAGVGSVAVVIKLEGEQVVLHVDDVYYVPGAEFGLFLLDLHMIKDSTLDWKQLRCPSLCHMIDGVYHR